MVYCSTNMGYSLLKGFTYYVRKIKMNILFYTYFRKKEIHILYIL